TRFSRDWSSDVCSSDLYDAGPSAFFASSGNGTIASGADVTNAQGEFTIEIPAELGDASQSQTYIVEATVRDESGQSVSGRGEVKIGRASCRERVVVSED